MQQPIKVESLQSFIDQYLPESVVAEPSYCLKKKCVAERALHDEQLYRTIIDHRRQFINLKGFDYDTLYPATLSILPLEHIMDAWREDYEYMLLHMIYDNEAPTFEQLIEAITDLQKEIKTLLYKSL